MSSEKLADLVAATWFVWAALALVVLGRVLLRARDARRLDRSGLDEIDRMDGTTFEFFLGDLFRRLGCRVEHTGGDLVVTRDGRRTAVRATRPSKQIGVEAVQDAIAAREANSCDEALVITNSSFTEAANKLARDNGIELWDRNVLMDVRLRADEALQPRAPEFPSCAACGRPVTEKVRNYCLERSSRFGGRIYCFPHQRDVPA